MHSCPKCRSTLHVFVIVLNILFPGRKGRPDIDITHDQLKLLHHKGYTARQMAAVFKCSTQLVYKRLYASGIRQRNKYASCGTRALQQLVTEIHKDHPESGCKVSQSEIHLIDCFHTFIRQSCRTTLSTSASSLNIITCAYHAHLVVIYYIKCSHNAHCTV
jgi:hypothetical protein